MKNFSVCNSYSCEAVGTYSKILDSASSPLANQRNSRPKGWLVPSKTPPRRQLPHCLGVVAGDFGTNSRFSARRSSSCHYVYRVAVDSIAAAAAARHLVLRQSWLNLAYFLIFGKRVCPFSALSAIRSTQKPRYQVTARNKYERLLN